MWPDQKRSIVGVTLDINGKGWTIPSHLGLSHEPGHSTSEKNRSMVTVCFQRVTEEPYVMIMGVPCDDRTLTNMVQEQGWYAFPVCE